MPPVLTRSSSGQASDGEPPEPQEYSLRLRGSVGDAVAPVAALVRLPQSAVAGVGMGGMGGTIQFGEGGGVMVGRLQFGDGDSIQVSTAARVREAWPRFALMSSRSLHTLRVFGLAHLLAPPSVLTSPPDTDSVAEHSLEQTRCSERDMVPLYPVARRRGLC
jgi:hypothetical protein